MTFTLPVGHLNPTDWHISLETGFTSSHAGCRHKPRLFSLFREPHRGYLSIEPHPRVPGPSDRGQANRICVKSVSSQLQNPKGLQQAQPPTAMPEQREKMVRFDFPSSAKRKGKSSWLLEKHCRSGKESAQNLCFTNQRSFLLWKENISPIAKGMLRHSIHGPYKSPFPSRGIKEQIPVSRGAQIMEIATDKSEWLLQSKPL